MPSNNQLKRKNGHDYYAGRWKYHITLSKHPQCPVFSSIVINSLTPDGVTKDYSTIGKNIWFGLKRLSHWEPAVELYQYMIMPDHVHLLLNVKRRLPRHLGVIIFELKRDISKNLRMIMANPDLMVFEEGYNDRIIYPERKLDDIFTYIRHNPYRLAVRRSHPDFFSKSRNLFIDGREIQAYGNLFHYRNPFKMPLIIHRNDTEAEYQQKLMDCMYYAYNGGIVVSAFISPREKEIRKEIETVGGRIILISDRPLADREKPMKHDFDLCTRGQLLIISPLDYLNYEKREHPPREQCLDMNELAIELCKDSPTMPAEN